MEQLAQRCATVAAAALTVGGLIAALTPMTQSPPEVQIRDFGLAAALNVDASSIVETVENHVRPELSGTGDLDALQVSLGDVVFGRGDGELGAGSTFNAGDLDQNLWSELLGGGFDPQSLPGGVLVEPDLGVFAAPSTGTFGGTDQAAASAAASAVAGISMFVQGIPAMQEALGAAVVAVESEYNAALVAAQMAAADRLFGDNAEANDVVNWIYSVNNSLLAQNESAFNSLFGITYDAHSSLLSHLEPGLADTDWNVLAGLSPDDFNDIVNALQAGNISLLASLDWAAMFSGLF